MKIFLDANILISVVNKEYPLFTYTSRILSLSGRTKLSMYTSPVCLAIAFYFAEKKHKHPVAKNKIEILHRHINITGITTATVAKALQNPSVIDFEDGLEYYSALESKCNCIITEDVQDFYFSEIEILKSEDFFNKYMAAYQVR
ncbi:MAG TPA: PIN domain-containing protein [Chitinophagaceae bacterium]|nr:PIN domain-containing protein [Chitinophagaceae bacterium]